MSDVVSRIGPFWRSEWDWSRVSLGVCRISQECLWEWMGLDKHSAQVGEIGHKCLWEQMAGLQCL